MRKKSEKKRQEIIETASVLFLERGFDAVTMSDIAAAQGGSKATLYNHFSRKEDVFGAVMLARGQQLAQKIYATLDKKIPLEEKLKQFGYEYLLFTLSPEMIETKRRVIAHADKMDIGATIYECGIKNTWTRVQNVLLASAASGELKPLDNPWEAALHFRGLLEGDLSIRRLLNIDVSLDEAKLRATAERALAVFFAYYKA